MSTNTYDKHIWLIRHAQTIQNIDPNMTNIPNEDIPLSDNGILQAYGLAKLSTTIVDKIYISPYKRTIRTAAPYIAKLVESGNIPTITVDKSLKEFNYYNTNIRDAINEFSDVNLFVKMINRYWDDLDPYASHGYATESFSQFFDRIMMFMNKLLDPSNNGKMAVFTHYYVIKLITNIIEQIPSDGVVKGNILDLNAIRGKISGNTNILKELMNCNRWDDKKIIYNGNGIYMHLRPDDPNDNTYRILEYRYVDRMIEDGTMGTNDLAE